MFKWHVAGMLIIPVTMVACNSTVVKPDPSTDASLPQTIVSSAENISLEPSYTMEATPAPARSPNRSARPPQPPIAYNNNRAENGKTAEQYQQEWQAEQQRKQRAAEQARLRYQLAAQREQAELTRQAELERQQQIAMAQQRRSQQERQAQEAQARQEAEQRRAQIHQRFLAQKKQMEEQAAQEDAAAERAAAQVRAAAQQRARAQQAQQAQRAQQQPRNIAQQRPGRVALAPRMAMPRPAAAPVRMMNASSRMYNGPGILQRLPDIVAAKIPNEAAIGAYVRNAQGGVALLTANADTPRSPASTMKLVTTYSGLGVLGPSYRWPTEVYTTGPISNGVLQGDVIIKGYGNPDFREADLMQLLQGLRARGVQHITGNLVADTSYFQIPYQDPGAFDGKPLADYNAQPEALLYNERGSCYEFRNLKGQVERVCPVLPRSKIAQNDLNTNLFGGFWKLWAGQLGGTLDGRFVRGVTPANAQLAYRHESQPLQEIIKTINKDSNNVMARQVLLSIGAKQYGAPGTPRKGAEAVGGFLESRGLNFPELRLENGSGLSRVERISARSLGELLVDAYNSPYRDAFMNSLAVLGVDGTVRNRMKSSPVQGRGRFKTGTLRDVRAIAGYLQAADGQVYVVSIIHNDSQARGSAKDAHDDLIEWVYAGASSAKQYR